MHYHIIPAPKLGALSKKAEVGWLTLALPTHSEMHQKEFEARQELDDDDACGSGQGHSLRACE